MGQYTSHLGCEIFPDCHYLWFSGSIGTLFWIVSLHCTANFGLVCRSFGGLFAGTSACV